MRDAETPSLRARLRRFAPLIVLVFVGFGVWYFGGRMPKDVGLRFSLPPTLRTSHGSIPRTLVTGLSGGLVDADGDAVATFDVPIPSGLDGPLAPPIGLQLKKGRYRANVRARGPAGASAALVGFFDVADPGEVRIELERDKSALTP